MFAEELADLKDRYPTRLHLVHVLSREPGESPLLSGRIDADRLARLLDTIVPGDAIDEWFLCGPYGMVVDAQAVLAGRGRAGVGGAHRAVPRRRAAGAAAPPGRRARRPAAEVTIVLDGRSSTLHDGPRRAGAGRGAARSAASCRTPARAGSARPAGPRSSTAR